MDRLTVRTLDEDRLEAAAIRAKFLGDLLPDLAIRTARVSEPDLPIERHDLHHAVVGSPTTEIAGACLDVMGLIVNGILVKGRKAGDVGEARRTKFGEDVRFEFLEGFDDHCVFFSVSASSAGLPWLHPAFHI